MRKIIQLLFFTGMITLSAGAFAQDSDTELAKKSQNPIENMISVPFNSNFNYGFGPKKNTQYLLDIKPVIPFSLNSSWNLITRTILPVAHQPNLLNSGYINGIGDLNPTLFLSPARPSAIIWGAGPVFILPTASNNQLGQGKWSLGPSVVVLAMPNNWVIGILAYNVWSVTGESSRPAVNALTVQYFVNYNFAHGWFITSSPVITANWKVKDPNRWTVPFGIGAGRVFKLGKQAISASIQGYDNLITPKVLGPKWQLELNLSLLFPDA